MLNSINNVCSLNVLLYSCIVQGCRFCLSTLICWGNYQELNVVSIADKKICFKCKYTYIVYVASCSEGFHWTWQCYPRDKNYPVPLILPLSCHRHQVIVLTLPLFVKWGMQIRRGGLLIEVYIILFINPWLQMTNNWKEIRCLLLYI